MYTNLDKTKLYQSLDDKEKTTFLYTILLSLNTDDIAKLFELSEDQKYSKKMKIIAQSKMDTLCHDKTLEECVAEFQKVVDCRVLLINFNRKTGAWYDTGFV